MDYTLDGNPRWTLLLNLWLDEIELAHPSADVVLDVYNPCDLMAALVHSGLGMELSELLPHVRSGLDLPGDDGRLLHGCLVWNGLGAEKAADLISRIYPDPIHWARLRGSDISWESDLALLEGLGLDYALFEFAPDHVSGPNLISAYDGRLVRTLATSDLTWPNIHPFRSWLEQIDIKHLLDGFRSTMIPINGGDQWLTIQSSAPTSED